MAINNYESSEISVLCSCFDTECVFVNNLTDINNF